MRSNNWIRSDTIFIENEQIETLSNRPPWVAALLEQPLPGKPPVRAAHRRYFDGRKYDFACDRYWRELLFTVEFPSDQRQESAAYYQTYPEGFDRINRRIGYNVRPSFIWSYEDAGYLGLILASRMMALPAYLAFCDSRWKTRMESAEKWLS